MATDGGRTAGRETTGRASRVRPPSSVSAGVAVRPGVGGEPTPHSREVLDVVARIPRGLVMTYGDVAEYVGRGSGRTVGAVMSRHGHEVEWQRVVRSDGRPNPADPGGALERLRREGTPLLPGSERVDLAAARWDGIPAR